MHRIDNFVQTADGAAKRVFGYINTTVKYQGKSAEMQVFIIPDLQQELYLGCDFWQAFALRPVMIEEIVYPDTLNTANPSPKQHPLSQVQRNQLATVIEQFPSSEKLGLGRTSLLNHAIDIGEAKPVKQRFYSVSPAVQKDMYRELDRMLDLGVIEESQSPWCSPMAIVRKANGKLDFAWMLGSLMKLPARTHTHFL